MNKKSVISFLSTKTGYQKYGASKLARMLNTNQETVKEALKEIKVSLPISSKNNTVKPDMLSGLDSKLKKEVLAFIKAKQTSAPITKINASPEPFKGGDPNNVLVIADTHEPFCKPGYLEHCRKVQEEYNCGTVVHIGDEVDLCAISQWEKDPDGFSAGNEVQLALQKMQRWYKTFPEVSVCIGNHSARVFRLARAAGIPKHFLKTYEDAWNAPKTWKWAENWEFNNVLYTHGNGLTGSAAAISLASQHRQSAVIGHIHTNAGIQYNASKKDLVFGMMLGGAIDDKQYAFAYAKDNIKKSIVGCGVVLAGIQPLYIPMQL